MFLPTVAFVKGVYTLGCVSQDLDPRNSILRDGGKFGSKHAVKFSKGNWHHKKIGKERVNREELSKV